MENSDEPVAVAVATNATTSLELDDSALEAYLASLSHNSVPSIIDATMGGSVEGVQQECLMHPELVNATDPVSCLSCRSSISRSY